MSVLLANAAKVAFSNNRYPEQCPLLGEESTLPPSSSFTNPSFVLKWNTIVSCFGSCSKTNLEKLELLQNLCLRIALWLCLLDIFSKNAFSTSYAQENSGKGGSQTPIKKLSTRGGVGIFYILFLRLYLTYFNKLLFVRKFFFKRLFIALAVSVWQPRIYTPLDSQPKLWYLWRFLKVPYFFFFFVI